MKIVRQFAYRATSALVAFALLLGIGLLAGHYYQTASDTSYSSVQPRSAQNVGASGQPTETQQPAATGTVSAGTPVTMNGGSASTPATYPCEAEPSGTVTCPRCSPCQYNSGAMVMCPLSDTSPSASIYCQPPRCMPCGDYSYRRAYCPEGTTTIACPVCGYNTTAADVCPL